MPNIEITIDPQVDAAYIQLTPKTVTTTIALTEDVNIDLDDNRCVVGIEVLTLAAEIPFSDLTTRYHVTSDVIDALRLIRPSVSTFVTNVLTVDNTGHRIEEGSRQTVTS